jgi:hypothetical protein
MKPNGLSRPQRGTQLRPAFGQTPVVDEDEVHRRLMASKRGPQKADPVDSPEVS